MARTRVGGLTEKGYDDIMTTNRVRGPAEKGHDDIMTTNRVRDLLRRVTMKY
jgi:hypothetical protein